MCRTVFFYAPLLKNKKNFDKLQKNREGREKKRKFKNQNYLADAEKKTGKKKKKKWNK